MVVKIDGIVILFYMQNKEPHDFTRLAIYGPPHEIVNYGRSYSNVDVHEQGIFHYAVEKTKKLEVKNKKSCFTFIKWDMN